MGRLTGKYKPGQKPPGKRFFSDYPLTQIQPLIRQLETLGDKYGGKTPAQVCMVSKPSP
jgi:aryl-alcohol dehydrogenase-like predicted oxidoreductase